MTVATFGIDIDVNAITYVGVIGAGAMGTGIVQVFLGAGCVVMFHDLDMDLCERASESIEKGLRKWEARGMIPSADAALKNLTLSPNLVGMHACQWIVEAISENAAAKAETFRAMGRFTREDAVLATNTSSISVTWLGAQSGRPERVVGMHFFNPAPVMQLVEVVPGLRTAPAVTEATQRFAERLGKVPVVSRDRPGFIANRILAPMLNEAIWALETGVGRAEDIDQVMRLGMNHPMGPLELADLIGLDVLLAILDVLHREFGDPKYHACPLLKKYVEAGWLGRKTGRGFYCYEPQP